MASPWLWVLMAFLCSPAGSHGLLSDYKICGDPACESLMSRVQALTDHHSNDCRFLSFRRGDTIFVYHRLTGRREDLWAGTIDKRFGYFPKDLVQEEQAYAVMEKVVETRKEDFFCMDESGYPIDSSHLDNDEEMKLHSQESETKTYTTDGTKEGQREHQQNIEDTTDKTSEDLVGSSTSSSSSSWFSSSVTGWFGLTKEDQNSDVAEAEEKDVKKEIQSQPSLASSLTGWLTLGGGGEPDDTRGTPHSASSTNKVETFRARRMSMDLEGGLSHDEEMETGVSRELSPNPETEDKPDREKEEESGSSSWFQMGIRALGLKQGTGDVDVQDMKTESQDTEKTNPEQVRTHDPADGSKTGQHVSPWIQTGSMEDISNQVDTRKTLEGSNNKEMNQDLSGGPGTEGQSGEQTPNDGHDFEVQMSADTTENINDDVGVEASPKVSEDHRGESSSQTPVMTVEPKVEEESEIIQVEKTETENLEEEPPGKTQLKEEEKQRNPAEALEGTQGKKKQEEDQRFKEQDQLEKGRGLKSEKKEAGMEELKEDLSPPESGSEQQPKRNLETSIAEDDENKIQDKEMNPDEEKDMEFKMKNEAGRTKVEDNSPDSSRAGLMVEGEGGAGLGDGSHHEEMLNEARGFSERMDEEPMVDLGQEEGRSESHDSDPEDSQKEETGSVGGRAWNPPTASAESFQTASHPSREGSTRGTFSFLDNALSLFSQSSDLRTKYSDKVQKPAVESALASPINASGSPPQDLNINSGPDQQPDSGSPQLHSPSPETSVDAASQTPEELPQTQELSRHYPNLCVHLDLQDSVLLLEKLGRLPLESLELVLSHPDPPDVDPSVVLDMVELVQSHIETLQVPGVSAEQTRTLFVLQRMEMLLEKIRNGFHVDPVDAQDPPDKDTRDAASCSTRMSDGQGSIDRNWSGNEDYCHAHKDHKDPTGGTALEKNKQKHGNSVHIAHSGSVDASGSSPLDQSGSSPLDQSGSSPLDQSGSSALDQSGSSPLDQSGSSALDQSGSSPLDQSGSSPLDQSGSSPLDQSGSPSLDQSGSSPLDQSGSPSLDQSGSSSLDQSGSPPLDHSVSPSLDQSGSPSLDQSGSSSLDHSVSPSLDQSGSPSLDQSGSSSLDHGESPSLDQRGSSSLDHGESPSLDQSGSSSLDHIGSPSLDQSGSSSQDQSGSSSLDHSGSPSLDQSGSPSLDQSGSSSLNQSGSSSLNQSGSSSRDQSGSPPLDHTGSLSLDQSGSPSLDQSGSPSLDQSGSSSRDQSGSPPLDQSGSPSLDHSSSPSLGYSGAPSLDHTGSPLLGYSGSPLLDHRGSPPLDHSVSPSLDHSVSPPLDHSVSPPLDHSVSPSLYHSVSPPLDQSGSPSLDHSVSPSLDHSVSPPLDQKGSPSLDHSVSPSLDHSVSPPLDHSGSPSLDHSVSPPLDHSGSPSLDPSGTPQLSKEVSHLTGSVQWAEHFPTDTWRTWKLWLSQQVRSQKGLTLIDLL